jgi:hypothetical protein
MITLLFFCFRDFRAPFSGPGPVKLSRLSRPLYGPETQNSLYFNPGNKKFWVKEFKFDSNLGPGPLMGKLRTGPFEKSGNYGNIGVDFD